LVYNNQWFKRIPSKKLSVAASWSPELVSPQVIFTRHLRQKPTPLNHELKQPWDKEPQVQENWRISQRIQMMMKNNKMRKRQHKFIRDYNSK